MIFYSKELILLHKMFQDFPKVTSICFEYDPEEEHLMKIGATRLTFINGISIPTDHLLSDYPKSNEVKSLMVELDIPLSQIESINNCIKSLGSEFAIAFTEEPITAQAINASIKKNQI